MCALSLGFIQMRCGHWQNVGNCPNWVLGKWWYFIGLLLTSGVLWIVCDLLWVQRLRKVFTNFAIGHCPSSNYLLLLSTNVWVCVVHWNKPVLHQRYFEKLCHILLISIFITNWNFFIINSLKINSDTLRETLLAKTQSKNINDYIVIK